MTEVLSFPRKRESRIKRVWIPNRVGDDNGSDFGDDSYCGFSVKLRMTKEDIKKEKKNRSPINTFGDDNGSDFGDDSDDVIPHLMRNPKYIPSSNINKEKIGLDFLQYDITHFRKF